MTSPTARASSLWIAALVVLACIGCNKHQTAETPREATLTDGEVLAVLLAIHQGEVEQAEIALEKASAPDVQGYASRMKSEHAQRVERLRAISSERNIVPAPSDLSARLVRASNAASGRLRDADRGDFDALYLRTMARSHEDALELITESIVPSISDGQLRYEAQADRDSVASHLEHAEHLRAAEDD